MRSRPQPSNASRRRRAWRAPGSPSRPRARPRSLGRASQRELVVLSLLFVPDGDQA
jgi:hypothetical protein